MARTVITTDKESTGSSGRTDGSGGGSTSGIDSTATADREEETVSSEPSVETVDNSSTADSAIVIEAPVTIDAPRRGHPRKLSTEDSSVPSPTASKRATFYITTLRDLWMDLHGFAGIIDDDLRWTLQESQRFAECAYEVCRARNWLRFLERASEARLIVLVLSIEMSKVQKVLEKQQPKVAKQSSIPPPLVRSGQNGQSNAPTIDPNGVPSFTVMPRFLPEDT